MIGLRTLVLNNDYQPVSLFPLSVIPVEDAVTRVINGTCHVVYEYDREIKTPTLEMKWPSVIARNHYDPIKNIVALRRDSLFYRDHGRCSYCGIELTIGQVTYDHVHPTSLGGSNTWDNIVAACVNCNSRKGHSMPVGQWKPRVTPYTPTYWQLVAARRKFPLSIDDKRWHDLIGQWDSDVIVNDRLAA